MKEVVSEEMRLTLANALAPYYHEAMGKEPADPLRVKVGEDTYLCSRHPARPGKMRVVR